MRSFVKINSPRNGEITLSTTDIGQSNPRSRKFQVASMSFNAIRENKILSKISRLTVFELKFHMYHQLDETMLN